MFFCYDLVNTVADGSFESRILFADIYAEEIMFASYFAMFCFVSDVQTQIYQKLWKFLTFDR